MDDQFTGLGPLAPSFGTGRSMAEMSRRKDMDSRQNPRNLDSTGIRSNGQRTQRKTHQLPLKDLVNIGVENSCPNSGLFLFNDTVILDTLDDRASRGRRIPKIIHVTSKTRCMPQEFISVLQEWTTKLPDHSFFFHNQQAMEYFLFEKSWPEFPHLSQVLRCTKGGAGMADVWRALMLYEYGGIYTDIDNVPAKFDSNTIRDDDDAFFVMEKSGILSQYFFAARPRHPLLYLLVHHMLSRLLALNDVNMQIVSLITGPGALRWAFCTFLNLQGPNFYYQGRNSAPSSACWNPDNGEARDRTFVGMNNFTVRLVGDANNSDEYVARDVIPDKNIIYRRMNMTYFRDLPKVETKTSCFQRIYEHYAAQFSDES